jgi:L-fucose isomerase-like protein
MVSGKDNPPKLGVVANSIKVFSPEGKQAAETQMRGLFEKLKQQGVIHQDSVYYPERIFGPLEAEKVADLFARERIDGMILLNSAFPNGNTFLKLAVNPYLRELPLIVTAPPEFESPQKQWSTNAYCGLIMNNHAAKRMGRRIFTVSGRPEDPAYQKEMQRLIAVIRAVRNLRSEVLGRFGEAPAGFHSANIDQLAYASLFGVLVESVDLSAVLETCRSGRASGYLGEASFTEDDVNCTHQRMMSVGKVIVDTEWVRSAARLFHAFKAIIDANGFTSAAVRCWPEISQTYKISACLTLSCLLSEGVVRAISCEGDLCCAVSQSIGAALSGRPAACLDFVNDLGAAKVIQLGHCGVGLPGSMAKCEIGVVSPDNQIGSLLGPACLGQYDYGPKTGICLIQDGGKFKMLAFTGQNKPETDKGLRYAAADVEVSNPQRLNELVLEHGFPHHLAVAFGDITRELRLFCEFYGIEYCNPDDR